MSPNMWAHVPNPQPDALFALNARFKADPNPDKLGLGVGAYRSEDGSPYVLDVVREADEFLAKSQMDKEYLQPDGHPDFLKYSAELLFGADCPLIPEGRIAGCQSISGTGGLRLVAEFLYRFTPPETTVLLSDPTWPNHPNVFRSAGFTNIKYHRYWDKDLRWLNWDGLKEDIMAAPDGSIIVLHLCSHNPSGADMTKEQWIEMADMVVAKKLVPFFDAAYQGYATGDLEADAFGLRHFVSRGISCCIAQSYAKNFGLYAERVGSVAVTCSTAAEAEAVRSQFRDIVGTLYATPVAHGARIVTHILGNPDLRARWCEELRMMSDRIGRMRILLVSELTKLGTPGDWSHVTRQIGMFSFTGLTEEQCELMISRHHVYAFPKDGRISIAGLSTTTCPKLAKAIHDALTNP